MVLGALVIIVVGLLVVNYLRDRGVLLREGGIATTESTPSTHTVNKGESLWMISEKYYGDGYAWSKIAEANNLTSPDLVEEGQTLTIPKVENIAAASAAPSIQDGTYTVVKGDHLWGIAVRAYGDGYKWVEIARANNIKNPNVLFVDTVLTLPR